MIVGKPTTAAVPASDFRNSRLLFVFLTASVYLLINNVVRLAAAAAERSGPHSNHYHCLVRPGQHSIHP